ncbi:uncharacterized protein LOC127044646 [Gopherus flavomarginatus]|uniref:uncharacterized protein LOC127044646 n=1 Tax=Gopherus flavomarginatus TaxID=286002 RepID=UPI0021CC1049|nr:uncharacterized protein LOC127044646 [Gopherus flavomarginatus]
MSPSQTHNPAWGGGPGAGLGWRTRAVSAGSELLPHHICQLGLCSNRSRCLWRENARKQGGSKRDSCNSFYLNYTAQCLIRKLREADLWVGWGCSHPSSVSGVLHATCTLQSLLDPKLGATRLLVVFVMGLCVLTMSDCNSVNMIDHRGNSKESNRRPGGASNNPSTAIVQQGNYNTMTRLHEATPGELLNLAWRDSAMPPRHAWTCASQAHGLRI